MTRKAMGYGIIFDGFSERDYNLHVQEINSMSVDRKLQIIRNQAFFMDKAAQIGCFQFIYLNMTSFWRSRSVNELYNGREDSRHLDGLAADILYKCPGEVSDYVKRWNKSGYGYSYSFELSAKNHGCFRYAAHFQLDLLGF